MGPSGLDGSAALRARFPDGGSADGTESESVFHERATVRARRYDGLAQQEVQDDAQAVEDENRQQRPHDITHPAAAGVGIHITDKRDVGY